MLNAEALASLYGMSVPRALPWVEPFKAACKIAELNSVPRLAAFLAQVGHESGNLRFMKEIWGPTPQQLRYEPVTSLSKRLGNTEPGDGFRYRGFGLIQLTGRANYAEMSKRLGLDLISQPDLLTVKLYAAQSAAHFWKSRNLNRFADSGDFVTLTKRINGGLNGLAHRQALYTKALILCSKSSLPF